MSTTLFLPSPVNSTFGPPSFGRPTYYRHPSSQHHTPPPSASLATPNWPSLNDWSALPPARSASIRDLPSPVETPPPGHAESHQQQVRQRLSMVNLLGKMPLTKSKHRHTNTISAHPGFSADDSFIAFDTPPMPNPSRLSTFSIDKSKSRKYASPPSSPLPSPPATPHSRSFNRRPTSHTPVKTSFGNGPGDLKVYPSIHGVIDNATHLPTHTEAGRQVSMIDFGLPSPTARSSKDEDKAKATIRSRRARRDTMDLPMMALQPMDTRPAMPEIDQHHLQKHQKQAVVEEQKAYRSTAADIASDWHIVSLPPHSRKAVRGQMIGLEAKSYNSSTTSRSLLHPNGSVDDFDTSSSVESHNSELGAEEVLEHLSGHLDDQWDGDLTAASVYTSAQHSRSKQHDHGSLHSSFRVTDQHRSNASTSFDNEEAALANGSIRSWRGARKRLSSLNQPPSVPASPQSSAVPIVRSSLPPASPAPSRPVPKTPTAGAYTDGRQPKLDRLVTSTSSGSPGILPTRTSSILASPLSPLRPSPHTGHLERTISDLSTKSTPVIPPRSASRSSFGLGDPHCSDTGPAPKASDAMLRRITSDKVHKGSGERDYTAMEKADTLQMGKQPLPSFRKSAKENAGHVGVQVPLILGSKVVVPGVPFDADDEKGYLSPGSPLPIHLRPLPPLPTAAVALKARAQSTGGAFLFPGKLHNRLLRPKRSSTTPEATVPMGQATPPPGPITPPSTAKVLPKLVARDEPHIGSISPPRPKDIAERRRGMTAMSFLAMEDPTKSRVQSEVSSAVGDMDDVPAMPQRKAGHTRNDSGVVTHIIPPEELARITSSRPRRGSDSEVSSPTSSDIDMRSNVARFGGSAYNLVSPPSLAVHKRASLQHKRRSVRSQNGPGPQQRKSSSQTLGSLRGFTYSYDDPEDDDVLALPTPLSPPPRPRVSASAAAVARAKHHPMVHPQVSPSQSHPSSPFEDDGRSAVTINTNDRPPTFYRESEHRRGEPPMPVLGAKHLKPHVTAGLDNWTLSEKIPSLGGRLYGASNSSSPQTPTRPDDSDAPYNMPTPQLGHSDNEQLTPSSVEMNPQQGHRQRRINPEPAGVRVADNHDDGYASTSSNDGSVRSGWSMEVKIGTVVNRKEDQVSQAARARLVNTDRTAKRVSTSSQKSSPTHRISGHRSNSGSFGQAQAEIFMVSPRSAEARVSLGATAGPPPVRRGSRLDSRHPGNIKLPRANQSNSSSPVSPVSPAYRGSPISPTFRSRGSISSPTTKTRNVTTPTFGSPTGPAHPGQAGVARGFAQGDSPTDRAAAERVEAMKIWLASKPRKSAERNGNERGNCVL